MKLNIYITDPCEFARDRNSNCYTAHPERVMDGVWTFCAEVEIDVSAHSGFATKEATDELNAEIARHTTAIDNLENRKKDLLELENRAVESCDEPDSNEESREEIGRQENHRIDLMERRP